MSEPTGEVFDLGYQSYEGPREGRMRARRAVWTNGMRTAIGLGRGSRAKILPIMLVIFTLAPAVIFALVASVADPEEDIPNHADYYRIVSVIVLIFSAIIAPELLCPDRRNGVIYLYLVRPLTAADYLAGRWLAFFSMILILIYTGQLILLIGYTMAADEPLTYLGDHWLDIPRFLGAGIVIAAFTTTLPLAASAFTTRRGYATAFVIGLYFISAPLAGILTECKPIDYAEGEPYQYEISNEDCERQTGEAARWCALIDIGQIPGHVNDHILNDKSESQVAKAARDLPAAIPVLWYLMMTAGPALILWWRYRRLSI